MRGVIVSWISQQTTFAPSRANKRAVARPMPLLAPVMIATLPLSRPSPGRSIACSSLRISTTVVSPYKRFSAGYGWRVRSTGSCPDRTLPYSHTPVFGEALLLIQLLDESRRIQFLDQTHVDITLRVRRCGLGILDREVVQHGLYTVGVRVGCFGKNVGIVLISSFQSLGIGNPPGFLGKPLGECLFGFN